MQRTTRITFGTAVLTAGLAAALMFPRSEAPRVEVRESSAAPALPVLPPHDVPLLAEQAEPLADAAVVPIPDPSRAASLPPAGGNAAPAVSTREATASPSSELQPIPRPRGSRAIGNVSAPPEPAERYPSLGDDRGSARTAMKFDFPMPRKPPPDNPAEYRAGERHRVVDGDTLARLAERYYGQRELAIEIFQANRDLMTDPDVLPIGVELVIPERATLLSPDAQQTAAGRMVPVE